MKRIGWLATALCLLALAGPSAAGEQTQGVDLISFQVDVERETANDHAEAVLSVTRESADAADVAQQINETMRWALESAKAQTGVEARSGSYQTYPVYDKNRIARWRGRQELILESDRIDTLSRLMGRLQSKLQVQSLRFTVAATTRQRAEDELIEKALKAFQARSLRISQGLGASGYEIVSMSLLSSGQAPPPLRPLQQEAVPTLTRAAVEAPAVQAGASRIAVQAKGTIRLKRN